ncbi:hypothetical protein [Photorhabdus kayaii]|nr:hypothetical protein [Photorhabdus kayaii]MCT8352786.1 hypothetical protein [Photorhabdus kayaii]
MTYTQWISRCIATARERSQQRGNLKDNGYTYWLIYSLLKHTIGYILL